MEMTDRENRRAAFVEQLTVEAARRFGAARAEALRPSIEEIAGQLADVALFPLDGEEGPAFYMDPSE